MLNFLGIVLSICDAMGAKTWNFLYFVAALSCGHGRNHKNSFVFNLDHLMTQGFVLIGFHNYLEFLHIICI